MYAHTHSLVKAKSNYLDPAWAQNLLKRPRYYDFDMFTAHVWSLPPFFVEGFEGMDHHPSIALSSLLPFRMETRAQA